MANYEHATKIINEDQGGLTPVYGGSAFVTGSGVDAAGAATKYLTAAGQNHAAAAVPLHVVTKVGVIRNLYASYVTAPGGTDTGVFAVMLSTDNGASYSATALTCTITGTTKAGSDTTHAVAVAAGNTLAIREVSSAGTAAGATVTFEVG